MASLAINIGEVRLRFITCWKLSSVVSVKDALMCIAALFTSTSSPLQRGGSCLNMCAFSLSSWMGLTSKVLNRLVDGTHTGGEVTEVLDQDENISGPCHFAMLGHIFQLLLAPMRGEFFLLKMN